MNLIRITTGGVLLIAMASGMDAQCNQQPCGPEHPDYNPATGLCTSTQPADDDNSDDTDNDTPGPAGPGTGGLPTEPNTQTPDTADDGIDPDSVNVDVYGLNGMWIDNNNGLDTCVIHTPSGVVGNYVAIRECDHGDGTGNTSTTLRNFEGQLVNGVITGTTTACKFGFDSGNGYVDAPMTLTVGEDGKTLTGSWYNSVDDEDVPFSLTRQTVGACGTQ